MIVAVHVGNPWGFEARYLDGDPLLRWVNLPGQVAVDLFFVISGLIMTITTWHLDRGPAVSRRFLARRVTRIYPIYWVVTGFALTVFLARPDLVNSHSSHPPDVLASFLLLPQQGLPLLAVGWTLTFEMYFYCVFAVALLFGRERLPWILAGWGAVTVGLSLAFGGSTDSSAALALLASPLSLEFLLGVVVGYLVMSRPPIAPSVLVAAGLVSLVVAVAVASRIDTVTFDSWYRVLLIGPSAALVVLGAVGLERRHRLIAHPRLQYLGDASYSIYLWHTLLLVAVGRTFVSALPATGGVLHAVLAIFVPAASVGLSVVLYERVERPLLNVLRRRPAPKARKAVA